MHAGGGFLGHAVDALEHLRILVVQDLGQVTAVVQHHVGIPRLAVLEDGLLDAPLVFFLGLALPGEHRDAGSGDGGSGLVLGGEDVAARPTHFRAERDQRLDQHGGLDGHVNAAEDLRALERLLGGVFLAQAHQRGHFGFGDDDFAAAPGSQGNIGDLEVGETGRRHDSTHRRVLHSYRCEWAPLMRSGNAPSEPDRFHPAAAPLGRVAGTVEAESTGEKPGDYSCAARQSQPRVARTTVCVRGSKTTGSVTLAGRNRFRRPP